MNQIMKISDTEYFAAKGISNSFLIQFDRSPAHAFTPISQTDSMKMGTMIHQFILTPEDFYETYIIAPSEVPNDKRTSAYKEFAKGQTKEILFQSDIEELERIRENVLHYRFEGSCLEDYLSVSEKEISLFWDLKLLGKDVQCKGKVDMLFMNGDRGIIFDFKKTQDCTKFGKSVEQYKYYRQANFYTTGLKVLYPHLTSVRFIFLTVEESAPYGVLDYELDDEYMYEGEKENYYSILKYLNWNGNTHEVYPNQTVTLKKPGWLCA